MIPLKMEIGNTNADYRAKGRLNGIGMQPGPAISIRVYIVRVK